MHISESIPPQSIHVYRYNFLQDCIHCVTTDELRIGKTYSKSMSNKYMYYNSNNNNHNYNNSIKYQFKCTSHEMQYAVYILTLLSWISTKYNIFVYLYTTSYHR